MTPGMKFGKFKPHSRYHAGMDFLLYLKEDVSYRADRVDAFLTLLWHPYEDRLVGLKLKGFHFIFQRVKSILDLKNRDFLPLVKALEVALTGGVAECMMNALEQQRIEEKYQKAKEFAKRVRVPPEEWKLAA